MARSNGKLTNSAREAVRVAVGELVTQIEAVYPSSVGGVPQYVVWGDGTSVRLQPTKKHPTIDIPRGEG